MAIQRLDTSGIRQSLGMLQQQRQYEEQVRLQEEARRKAEWERKHAKDKQRAAEKRAAHTATVTAVATVGGAVAGSFVPVVGTGLGAAVGGAIGTAASGGTVSPGQIANIGTSAISQHSANKARAAQSKQNSAMLTQWSKIDPEFVSSTGMQKNELMGMDSQALGALMQASGEAFRYNQNNDQKSNYNSMLIEAYTSNPDTTKEAKDSYISTMKKFQYAPIAMQESANKHLKDGRKVNPASLVWQAYTGTSADQMPQGFKDLNDKQQIMLMDNTYFQNNPDKINITASKAYQTADPETKLKMLQPVINEMSVHPSTKVQNLATKQYAPEAKKLRESLAGNIDYVGIKSQVDSIFDDVDIMKQYKSGAFDIRVGNDGKIVMLPPEEAGEMSFQDNAAAMFVHAKENNLNLDNELSNIKLYLAKGKSAGDMTAAIAASRGYDITKNPEQAAEVIRDAAMYEKQALVTGDAIGKTRAANTVVTADMFSPTAKNFITVGKDNTANYQQSLTKLATLPREEKPIDRATRAHYTKQGIDTTGLMTIGDLDKKIEKVETNIGKISAKTLVATDYLIDQAEKVAILSRGAGDLIGPISGGAFLHTNGFFDMDVETYVSPEEFTKLGMPELKTGEDGNGIKIKFSQSQLNTMLTNIQNEMIRDRSGAAVSVPEFDRFKKEAPFLNDFGKNFDAKIMQMVRNLKNYRGTLAEYETAGSVNAGDIPQGSTIPIGQPSVSQPQMKATPAVFNVNGEKIVDTRPDYSVMSDSEMRAYFSSLTPEQRKQELERMGQNGK